MKLFRSFFLNIGCFMSSINGYFKNFFINYHKKNISIDESVFLNNIIMGITFTESPEFILIVKNSNDGKISEYKSKITEYPYYIKKNNINLKKIFFKNIIISSLYYIDNHYIITDTNYNSYKLYCEPFIK